MTRRRITADSWRAMTADEAAAQWLVLRNGSDWNASDQAAFEDWLAQARANRVAMDRAEQAWGVFDAAPGDPLLESMRRSALAVRPERSVRWQRAVAATTIAAAALVAMVWFADGGRIVVEAGRDAPRTAQATVPAADALRRWGDPDFTTVRGQRSEIVLPDGTQVTLNTETEIDVAFERDKRLVHLLKGEAFFNVAHDASRPFTVAAADRHITALGTQFDVRLDAAALRVVLVTGRVHVARAAAIGADKKPGADMDLLPGDRLTAALGAPVVIERLPDVAAETSWLRGLVEFSDAPLGEAVNELNRYAEEPLVIRDREVAELRISGVFRTGDPARFARVISELVPVEIVRADNGESQLVLRTEQR